jgi:hypothetical protein
MESQAIQMLALTLGVGWASGINLYAAILTLGLMNAMGYAALPPELQVLSDPLVLLAAGFMYFIEFFADKTPGVDTGWDGLHTFIRIPAGAVLAAGAASGLGISEPAQLAAGLVGGTLAAGSHFTKAGSRVLINTSPEPFSNWTASFAEDMAVVAGLWAALAHPWVFLGLLVLFILLVAWLLPRLWRAIKSLLRRIRGFFGGGSAQKPPSEAIKPAPSVGDNSNEALGNGQGKVEGKGP